MLKIINKITRVGWKFSLFLGLILANGFKVYGQVSPVKIWEKTYSRMENDDVPTQTYLTTDGGCILGGVTRSRNSRESGRWDADYLVIKLDKNGNQQWRNNFGGTNDDKLKILKGTTDGGYILGGNSSSSINGNKTQPSYGEDDFWIVKLDPSGDKLWERSLGGKGYENLTALYLTSDGGYIVGGISNLSETNNTVSNYQIIKLDNNGNIRWEKLIGYDASKLHQMALHLVPDGNFIISGTIFPSTLNKTSLIDTDTNFLLVKLDANGRVLWDKTFGGLKYEYLENLVLTTDGGYLLTGSSLSDAGGDKSTPNKGRADVWLIKVNADGKKVWDRSIASKLDEELYSFVQTSDGGYALLMNADRMKTGKEVLAMKHEGILSKVKSRKRVGKGLSVIKMDSNGNIQWEKIFGLTTHSLSGLEIDKSGGLAFMVYAREPAKKRGIKLISLSAEGKINNEITFNYSDFDRWIHYANGSSKKFSIHFTSERGFIIEGREGSNLNYPHYKSSDNIITWFKIIKYDFLAK